MTLAKPGTALGGNAALGLARRASGVVSALAAAPGGPYGLVHACDLETLPVALLYKPAGAEVVLDLHDLPPAALEPLWALAGLADRILTVNEALKDAIVRRTGFPARILENWTLPEERVLPDRHRLRLRRELGLAEDDFALVYSGSLFPGRGIEILGDLAKFAPPGLRLFAKGAGPLAPPPGVTRLAPSPPARLVADLAFADCGLIPYPLASANQRAGLPSKLFEYAAAGLAVVSTPMPLVAARLERYGLGAIYATGDARALLRRLETVRRSPAPFRAAALAFTARRDFASALGRLIAG